MGGLFCYTYLKDGRRFTPASFWCAQNEFKTCGFAAVFLFPCTRSSKLGSSRKQKNHVITWF